MKPIPNLKNTKKGVSNEIRFHLDPGCSGFAIHNLKTKDLQSGYCTAIEEHYIRTGIQGKLFSECTSKTG